MAEEFILNQAGYDALKAELQELLTVGRNNIREKIQEAKSFGDLSENSEYDAALDEQAKMEARITEIEHILQNARIVDESSLSTDIIHVGSKVRVFHSVRKAEMELQVVGFPQADPAAGKISDESPIGKALLGHKPGDMVEVETPRGIIELTVLDIMR